MRKHVLSTQVATVLRRTRQITAFRASKAYLFQVRNAHSLLAGLASELTLPHDIDIDDKLCLSLFCFWRRVVMVVDVRVVVVLDRCMHF